jgi:DNA replication protein DnaD
MKAIQIQMEETQTLAEKLLEEANRRLDDPQIKMLLMMFEGNIRSIPDEQIRNSCEECIEFLTSLINE